MAHGTAQQAAGMWPVLSPGHRALLHPLKLLILVAIVAWGIEVVSTWSLGRWFVAATLVLGARMVADGVDVRRRGSARRLHSPAGRHAARRRHVEVPATPETQPAQAAHCSVEPHAWRAAVGNEAVVAAWDRFSGAVVVEFVYSWWAPLSPDREFPAAARRLLNHAFGEVARRARERSAIEWGSIFINEGSQALCRGMVQYRRAVVLAGGRDALRGLGPEARDAALREAIARKGGLHPALARPDGHYRFLRALAEGLVGQLLPPGEGDSLVLAAMLRELMACCVLRSSLWFFTPGELNKLFLRCWPDGKGDAGGVAAGGPFAAAAAAAGYEAFEARVLRSAEDEARAAAMAMARFRPSVAAENPWRSGEKQVLEVTGGGRDRWQAAPPLTSTPQPNLARHRRTGSDPAALLARFDAAVCAMGPSAQWPTGSAPRMLQTPPPVPLPGGAIKRSITRSGSAGDAAAGPAAVAAARTRATAHAEAGDDNGLGASGSSSTAGGRRLLPAVPRAPSPLGGRAADAGGQRTLAWGQSRGAEAGGSSPAVVAQVRLTGPKAKGSSWSALASLAASTGTRGGGGAAADACEMVPSPSRDSSSCSSNNSWERSGCSRSSSICSAGDDASGRSRGVVDRVLSTPPALGRAVSDVPPGYRSVAWQQQANPLPTAALDGQAQPARSSAGLAKSSPDLVLLAGAAGGGSPPRAPLPSGRSDSSPSRSASPGLGPEGEAVGLSAPLVEAVDCVLQLQGRAGPGWVRRQALAIARQLLTLLAGGALDGVVARGVSQIASPASLAARIDALRASLWPGGVLFSRAAADRAATAAAASTPGSANGRVVHGDRGHTLSGGSPAAAAGHGAGSAQGTAHAAGHVPGLAAERYLEPAGPLSPAAVADADAVKRRLLSLPVPAPLLALLGRGAWLRSLHELYDAAQTPSVTLALGYALLEAALVALFPELAGLVERLHATEP